MDELSLFGGKVTPLVNRAAWIPKSRSLIVADLHLGKSAAFRKQGIPIPEGDTYSDLKLIFDLCDQTRASELIIAGDLFHSLGGFSTYVRGQLSEWLDRLEIPVILTLGNHDQRLNLDGLSLTVENQVLRDGLKICHDPDDLREGELGIAGHVHPAVKLRVRGQPAMTLRGFYLRYGKQLILPAFSEFTGNYFVEVGEGERFFSCDFGKLREIPQDSI